MFLIHLSPDEVLATRAPFMSYCRRDTFDPKLIYRDKQTQRAALVITLRQRLRV